MHRRRTSKASIQDPNFLRNEFMGANHWDIPTIKKCSLVDPDIRFLSFSSIKNEDKKRVDRTIHFFVDDYKMRTLLNQHPSGYAKKLAQYAGVISPDFSLLTDMPLYAQIHHVGQNRYCGAIWQELGINVIPSISWSDEKSYDFAFLGIETGSAVAISTLGVRKGAAEKQLFLKGYNEMLRRIQPIVVYCYGQPLKGMQGALIYISYEATIKGAC